MRIKFLKQNEQRKFFESVMLEINCPSLRELAKRLDVSYSTLKNYFIERRALPESFFHDLCFLAKMIAEDFNVEKLKDNWGQIKGGKKSRK